MARIADLLAAGPTFSFEFGPPRDDAGQQRLEKTLLKLEPLGPSFVSVTYGAGGTTRDRTREIVEHIARDTAMTPMPHLTCVAHTRAEVGEILAGYRAAGMENILALGGDPPLDGSSYPTDYAYATDLIASVREAGDFSVGVAAFPEGHPRSPDLETDRRFLAEKLRVADFAITQFGFDPDDHFRMVDDLARLGVDTPVLPGVMCFINVPGLRRMAGLNGARIPAALGERLDRVDGDPTAVRELAVEVATDLGRRYLDGGAPGLHLYTMNAWTGPTEVWRNLGLGERLGHR